MSAAGCGSGHVCRCWARGQLPWLPRSPPGRQPAGACKRKLQPGAGGQGLRSSAGSPRSGTERTMASSVTTSCASHSPYGLALLYRFFICGAAGRRGGSGGCVVQGEMGRRWRVAVLGGQGYMGAQTPPAAAAATGHSGRGPNAKHFVPATAPPRRPPAGARQSRPAGCCRASAAPSAPPPAAVGRGGREGHGGTVARVRGRGREGTAAGVLQRRGLPSNSQSLPPSLHRIPRSDSRAANNPAAAAAAGRAWGGMSTTPTSDPMITRPPRVT